MNDDEYDRPIGRPCLNFLRIAIACMAVAFSLILYCSIAGMG